MEHVLAVCAIGFAIYHLCFIVTRNASTSMSPTIQGTAWANGDLVVTERVSYWVRGPRRWEVATIRNPDGTLIMKRVVGLPGERVQILRGGQIMIDGEPMRPPASLSFLKHLPYGNVSAEKVAECQNGYYVLGDYSRDSDDSRFNGPVSRRDMVGRTWLIATPLPRFGFVNP
jgi:signal peptidase I